MLTKIILRKFSQEVNVVMTRVFWWSLHGAVNETSCVMWLNYHFHFNRLWKTSTAQCLCVLIGEHMSFYLQPLTQMYDVYKTVFKKVMKEVLNMSASHLMVNWFVQLHGTKLLEFGVLRQVITDAFSIVKVKCSVLFAVKGYLELLSVVLTTLLLFMSTCPKQP